MYYNIICRNKYVTSSIVVSVKLIDKETKGTSIGHTGDTVEHIHIFFHKVAYSRYDVHSNIF